MKMPTSFAIAVLADLGWARMAVMKVSDNMMGHGGLAVDLCKLLSSNRVSVVARREI